VDVEEGRGEAAAHDDEEGKGDQRAHLRHGRITIPTAWSVYSCAAAENALRARLVPGSYLGSYRGASTSAASPQTALRQAARARRPAAVVR